VTVTRSLEKIVLNEWKFSRYNVAYIPNGVNLPKFSQTLCDNSAETVVVAIVAKLCPEKRFVVLQLPFKDLKRIY
jgi:hypothetical protein